MSETENAGGSPPIQGPLSPGAEKALKIAVVVMGIMIVVGVGVVIGRILYLASQPDTKSRRAPTAVTAGEFVQKAGLSLPAAARIESISLDGARLAVHYVNPADGSRGIRIVDLSTGSLLSDIEITASPPTGGDK